MAHAEAVQDIGSTLCESALIGRLLVAKTADLPKRARCVESGDVADDLSGQSSEIIRLTTSLAKAITSLPVALFSSLAMAISNAA